MSKRAEFFEHVLRDMPESRVATVKVCMKEYIKSRLGSFVMDIDSLGIDIIKDMLEIIDDPDTWEKFVASSKLAHDYIYSGSFTPKQQVDPEILSISILIDDSCVNPTEKAARLVQKHFLRTPPPWIASYQQNERLDPYIKMKRLDKTQHLISSFPNHAEGCSLKRLTSQWCLVCFEQFGFTVSDGEIVKMPQTLSKRYYASFPNAISASGSRVVDKALFFRGKRVALPGPVTCIHSFLHDYIFNNDFFVESQSHFSSDMFHWFNYFIRSVIIEIFPLELRRMMDAYYATKTLRRLISCTSITTVDALIDAGADLRCPSIPFYCPSKFDISSVIAGGKVETANRVIDEMGQEAYHAIKNAKKRFKVTMYTKLFR